MPVIFILVVDLNLVIFLGMLCMYIKCHKKSQISYRNFFFLIFWLVQPVVVVCSKENVDSFAIFIFIYRMCVCVCIYWHCSHRQVEFFFFCIYFKLFTSTCIFGCCLNKSHLFFLLMSFQRCVHHIWVWYEKRKYLNRRM